MQGIKVGSMVRSDEFSDPLEVLGVSEKYLYLGRRASDKGPFRLERVVEASRSDLVVL